MILKNGSTETALEIHDMRVAVKLPIRNKDQSGDSTATDTTTGGTKAKIISVSGRIAKEAAENLRTLIRLAEAENDDGSRVQYTISDDTAEAADVRTVIFHEDLDAREIEGLHAWAVTFSLREVISVPELKQQRAAANTITATPDTATGQTIAAATPEEQATQQQQGFIYGLLKDLDEYLAPEADA